MSQQSRHAEPPVFTVSADAMLSVGGHATVIPDVFMPGDAVVDIGVFVGGSTFVGHGTISGGTARVRLRNDLSGIVTMFVSVRGEVRGVLEALVTDHMELLVVHRGAYVDLLAVLRSFGAVATEVEVTTTLDPEAAHAWMAGLALEPPVERRGPPAGQGTARGRVWGSARPKTPGGRALHDE